MEQQARRVIERDFLGVGSFIIWPEPVRLCLSTTQTLCEGSKQLRRLELPIDSRQLSETDLTVLLLQLMLIGQAKVCTDIHFVDGQIAQGNVSSQQWLLPLIGDQWHHCWLLSFSLWWPTADKDTCTFKFVHYVVTDGTVRFNATEVSVEVPRLTVENGISITTAQQSSIIKVSA